MASLLIIGSKLSDEQLRSLVWGFACGAPKSDISRQTGISEKRVVLLTLALRERLSRPAFYAWNAPGDVFLTYNWPAAEEAAYNAVFGVIAACYFDKRCVSNYRQGRRTQRICRHCMINALFEDTDTTERAVAFIDVIRAFYQHLGIGGERGRSQTDIMFLRWRHTMIVTRARETSRLLGNVPVFDDAGERSCRRLYDRLIEDLETEPLAV